MNFRSNVKFFSENMFPIVLAICMVVIILTLAGDMATKERPDWTEDSVTLTCTVQ